MARPRKTRSRDVRKRILIICEGEKTEPLYFNGIKKEHRASALNIEILKRIKNSALELVSKAIELKEEAENEKNPYECIWVVIDRDSYTKLKDTFTLAYENNIYIAFSSLCFEIWYLLHFIYTSRPFKNFSELKKELQKHLSDYDKSESDLYARMKDNTSNAIKNAKKLRKHHKSDLESGTKVYELDAYTNVDELVEILIKEEQI